MKKKKLKGQLDFFDYTQAKYKESIQNNSLSKSFTECINCWCYDCKHNLYNEGVPRDLCGNMMPCPACDECIKNGVASVCEIGSAKNGCALRAKEEQGTLEN